MTDDKPDINDLRETVTELRERVSELERRVGSTDHETAESAALDRYDRDVRRILDESVGESHPREVMQAYEMAGVVDKNKQKRRTKRLKRMEGENE